MKTRFIFALLLLSFFFKANAQVGINTLTPQAALDINGDVIVRTANILSGNASIVARNNTSGLIGVLPQINLTYTSVASGATASQSVTSLFYPGAGHLIVTASNGCSRYMTVVFSVVVSSSTDFGLSLVYQNGMAREVVGTATRVNAYTYQVVFPSVTTCADGGNGTQFDFTINASVPGTISITNNGNIARTYNVKISQII